MGLLFPFAPHKKVCHCDGSIVIFNGFWIKIIIYKNYLVYYGLAFGKNLTRPLFISNFMFMFGYYNEFKFVQRQIIFKLFLKENWVNNYLYHTINQCSMLMTLDVF